MNTWNVDTAKEARQFMAACIDPEKIVGSGGAPLCKFRTTIAWEEYERIRELAG